MRLRILHPEQDDWHIRVHWIHYRNRRGRRVRTKVRYTWTERLAKGTSTMLCSSVPRESISTVSKLFFKICFISIRFVLTTSKKCPVKLEWWQKYKKIDSPTTFLSQMVLKAKIKTKNSTLNNQNAIFSKASTPKKIYYHQYCGSRLLAKIPYWKT